MSTTSSQLTRVPTAASGIQGGRGQSYPTSGRQASAKNMINKKGITMDPAPLGRSGGVTPLLYFTLPGSKAGSAVDRIPNIGTRNIQDLGYARQVQKFTQSVHPFA